MQNPNEDTQWNDALRSKGILPPKQQDEAAITEDTLVQGNPLRRRFIDHLMGTSINMVVCDEYTSFRYGTHEMVEQTVQQKSEGNNKPLEDMSLDELDELEDEEDERILQQYRRQRMAEMLAIQQKALFGAVKEITAVDYVGEVNKAGEDVCVILHLYKTGIPLCALLNQHLTQLAARFPATKFLKSISTTCIPNYPDRNLPTMFVYCNGDMKGQIVGGIQFGGMNITVEELEWMLSERGGIKSKLEEDPRKKRKVRDVMSEAVKWSYKDAEDSDDNSD